MKTYYATASIVVDYPGLIGRAMCLLTTHPAVDIFVPSISTADRYLLNQVTLSLYDHGFPPAVVYQAGDKWRLHALSKLNRTPSIYTAKSKPALGTTEPPDAA